MANLPVEIVVNVVGELTGETYKGTFKIKPRLSMKDRLTRDQIRRDLLGVKADDAGPDAVNISTVFSKIYSHMVDGGPSWWKDAKNGLELEDESPAGALYAEIIRVEKESVDALIEKGKKAEEALKKE